MILRSIGTAFLLFFGSFTATFAQISLQTERLNASYQISETATFRVNSAQSGAAVWEIFYDTKLAPIAAGTIILTGGQNAQIPYKAIEAGVFFCRITQNYQSATASAAFSPLQIKPLDAEPTDFDAFWTTQKNALAAIPMDAKLTFFYASARSTTYRINLAQINNRRIYGYLTVPQGVGPFPAVVNFPALGSGANNAVPLDYLCDELGAIVFAVSIHNAEPDQIDPNAYLPNDATNRDNFYYKTAILAGQRAVEYLFSRNDFDKTSLVTMGESQGGGLAMMTAGLDSRVKLCVQSIPALCEHGGFTRNKASGFPRFVETVSISTYQDAVKVSAASNAVRYYDATFFARRFNGATLAAVGFLDEISPASSIFAQLNQLRGSVNIIQGATLGHNHPSEYWSDRTDLIRRFLLPTRNPQNNPFPPQGTGWISNAGADLTTKTTVSTAISGKIFQNALENYAIPVKWEVVEAPVGGNVVFSAPNNRLSNATFSAVGTYILRFSGEETSQLAANRRWTLLADFVKITVDANVVIPPPPPPPSTNYCASKGNEPWWQWVARVRFGTIDKTSGKDQYANNIASITDIEVNKATDIRLTPNYSWTVFDEYWRVWVDLNRDNDFEDAGEMVFEKHGLNEISGNFIIPNGTTTGATRMRISMKNGSYATPCETFQFGEVEDYSVNIIAGTVTPPPPPPPPAANYCVAKSLFPWHEWVNTVQIGTTQFNYSSKSDYSDFTSKTFNFVAGQPEFMKILAQYSFNTFAENVAVFIDFNQNKIFDSTERVFNQPILPPNSQVDVLASTENQVNIPATATLGATRMRVILSRELILDPCANVGFGEIEDFSVNISASANGSSANRQPDFLDFSANNEKGGAQIRFAAQFNKMISSIELEHSLDEMQFDRLKILPNWEMTGQFMHKKPSVGLHFYRLKVQFTNGETIYSNVKKVDFTGLADFSVFPNPSNGTFSIDSEAFLGKSLTIRLLDARGITVRTENILEIAQKTTDFNFEKLVPGVYFLWLESANFRPIVTKFFIEQP
jgi:cephalosporin-C deacetylase-like acetyl esterase